MQFDSATFVAFFAAVLTVYVLTRQWAARKNWLLIDNDIPALRAIPR